MVAVQVGDIIPDIGDRKNYLDTLFIGTGDFSADLDILFRRQFA